MVKYDGYAIVTGGARGMGAAICRQLAADGYDIVCNYISTSSKAKVEALAAEIREKYGHKVIAAQGDVSRFEDCQKVVQTAVDTLGEKIGVLVNNAGITVRAELADMSQSEILRVMNTNLMAGIYMCRLVLPYMYRQNSGSIVNITSVGGMTGFPRRCQVGHERSHQGSGQGGWPPRYPGQRSSSRLHCHRHDAGEQARL